jgi:hypothetical protein
MITRLLPCASMAVEPTSNLEGVNLETVGGGDGQTAKGAVLFLRDLHTTRAVTVLLYGGTSIGFGIRAKQDEDLPMRWLLTMRDAMRTTRRNRVFGAVGLLVFLTVPGAGRAQAQYGYAGSYGAYAGYGAGMGMTLADQLLLKEQIYNLNASQFQLNQVLAEREYWAGVLIREQAVSAALANRRMIEALRAAGPGQPQRGGVARRARRGAVATRTARQPQLAQRNLPAAPQRAE